MAKLTILNVEQQIPLSLLEEFKQYAGMPDSSRDAVLRGLLQSAILRVQEYGDKALLKCKARQISEMTESGVIRLYLGGGDVEDVKDTIYGISVPYDALPGGKLRILAACSGVEVTFETKPEPGELERAKATVLRYATALFDGDNTEVLNSILNEVL